MFLDIQILERHTDWEMLMQDLEIFGHVSMCYQQHEQILFFYY